MHKNYLITLALTSFFNCLGMIESVGIFTNDENKEVCIFGQAASVPLTDETRVLQQHLERWSKSPTPSTCFICMNKRVTYMKKEAAGPLKTEDGLSYICDPFCMMIDFAHKGNKYGSIDFIFFPQDRIFEYQLSFFSNNLKVMFETTISLPIETCEEAFQVKRQRDQFFAPDGLFTRAFAINQPIFIQSLKRLNDTECTVDEYFAHFDATINKFRKAAQSVNSNRKLQEVLENYFARASLARQKLRNFFDRYAKNGQSTLTEPQIVALKEGNSIKKTYHEIKAAIAPCITVINSLKTLMGIMEILTNTSRVFLFNGEGVVLDLYKSLQELGFSARLEGNLESSLGNSVILKKIFTEQRFTSLLESIFNDNPRKQKEASGITIIPLSYLNEEKKTISTKPLSDHGRYTCKNCKLVSDSQYMYAITLDQQAYCSFNCFLKHLLNATSLIKPILELLKKSHPLNTDDIIILKRCAALLHYSMLPFAHQCIDDCNPLYSCNQKKLIKLLEKAHTKLPIDCQHKDLLLWKSAADLASIFGCDSLKFSFILKIIHDAKMLFTKKLVSKARSRNYKLLPDEVLPSFDENDLIKKIQAQYISGLNKKLEFSEFTRRFTLCTLYRNLLDFIIERLEVSSLDYEAIMAETINNAIVADAQQSKGHSSEKILQEDTGAAESEETKDAEEEQDHPSTDTEEYIPVKKRPYSPIKQIQSYFARKEPYLITLFNARKYFLHTPETTAAKEQFSKCSEFKEAFRIKMLFALLENGIDSGTLDFTDAHSCILRYAPENIDASLVEKLDLHHLFTRSVDPYLFSCGIVEKLDDLIQVSIPGKISINGKSKVGFFQYSFQVGQWKCIHRCFKEYHQNLGETYISKPLRKASLAFLQEHMAGNDDCADVINHLERLCRD